MKGLETRYILILGGLGYLGANIAKFHRDMGHNVVIVCRKSSIYKRWFIYRDLRKMGVKFFIEEKLQPLHLKRIVGKWGCPHIFYLTMGKLYASKKDMLNAHAILPYLWSKHLIEKRCKTLIVFISHAFQTSCYKLSVYDRYIIVKEEDPHLEGCVLWTAYEETKALGERLLMSIPHVKAKIIILRPGLLIGKWAYHPEWKALYTISKLGIRLGQGLRLPITPAQDIARIAYFLSEKENYIGLLDSNWYFATPYTIDLGDLQKIMMEVLASKEKVVISIEKFYRYFETNLAVSLLRIPSKLALPKNYVYSVSKLAKLGFRKWTPLDESIEECIKWIRDNWRKAR